MTDERITAYLLEELTEQESEQFEEQCFAQDEWPAEIAAVEQDLIDAYLRNELTSDRKKRFQERYLTTDARKARVLTAKSFHATLCPPKVTTWREWLQTFFQRPLVPQTIVAVLVVAVGIGIFFIWSGRPKTSTQIELAMSVSERSTGTRPLRVPIPLNYDVLKISLKLPSPPPDTAGYRVQLQDGNGRVSDRPIESQDAQSVVVSIPASELKPGQYLLKLSNNNGLIGNYFFTAEPRTR
jgi:hypothetical protein